MSKEETITKENHSINQDIITKNNKEIQKLEKLANKLSLIILTAFPLAIVAIVIKLITK
ncbi:MAG: hypothetical protein M0R38_13120 [Bacteroidia bacterium]|nr:hypothetical protein [Bacteroidia bacterium]